jgi:hypothetical protein
MEKNKEKRQETYTFHSPPNWSFGDLVSKVKILNGDDKLAKMFLKNIKKDK